MSAADSSNVPISGLARRALVAVAAVAASVVLLVGSESEQTTTQTSAPPLASGALAATQPTTTTAVLTEQLPWTIAYPADWHRADSELMPALGWDSITLSTSPIPTGSTRCAHMPEAALRELGPGEALVSVFMSGVEGAAWPDDGFDDLVFPVTARTEAAECAGREDLQIHWGPWSIEGTGVYVLVAFGTDVAPEVRSETWGVLWSLRPGSLSNTCVVTRPTEPDWTPPAPYNPTPSASTFAWFGGPDLWTPLQSELPWTYVPRKSVWWSRHFTVDDAAVDVVFERIDTDSTDVVELNGSGVSHTLGDGYFVVAGIEPDETGCWRVTASTHVAEVSYVFWVPAA